MEPSFTLGGERATDGMVELPTHSRLPRLDLGIEWASSWGEFRTSLHDFFSGPRPDKSAVLPPGSVLRARWIRGRFPGKAFFASSLWHVAFIGLLLLPIWGFLPAPAHTLAPVQIELTWYVPPDLPNLSLPAPTRKSPAVKSETKAPAPRGADTFNPRQTIRSVPVILTHPRQTLIQPDAPPEPPKIKVPLPNIVQWAAPKPRVVLPAEASAPRVQDRKIREVAAPDVPNAEKNLGALNILSTPVVIERPKLPVIPMSARATARERNQTNDASAPEIAATNGNDSDLRRVIALSATPAPPAPKVAIPEGNLAANISISPDGGKSGTADSSKHANAGGDPSASRAGDSEVGADAGAAGNPSAANSLPAAVNISGGNNHSNSGRTSELYSEKLNLKLPALPLGTLPRSADTPAVANFDPMLPPEKILSGKEVYTMHVSSPNFTSVSGSWVVNFAQLDDGSGSAFRPKGELSGPVAIHQADPKYPPALIEQHVKGEVILYAIIRKDGSIDSIQLVKGLDPQLDRNAITAFGQWKFRPGTRAGVPVDIEAVIHIPFLYQSP